MPDITRTGVADANTTLQVVLSIDVEEEGLFGGSYSSSASVRNVAWLESLIPLLHAQDMPITLLCTHSVFSDASACRAMDVLRTECRVEVGAHLHHWSTPPLEENAHPEIYRSAGDVPKAMMEAKLHALFEAGHNYAGHALTSFRMGRWDLHHSHWPLLAQCGVLTDSSVRPLHCGTGLPTPSATMPDHFAAPAHPYFVHIPINGKTHEIFEAPLTCVPLISPLRPLLNALPRPLRAKVQKVGALATQPVYHPLWALRCITKAQLAQGQRVLALTWHSSEMMPGGAPHIPDKTAARALLTRIADYLTWLRAYWKKQCPQGEVRGVTLNELRANALHLNQGRLSQSPLPQSRVTQATTANATVPHAGQSPTRPHTDWIY